MGKAASAQRRKHKPLLLSMLRDLRKDAGLTQVALAESLRVPQSFVSKYESGERRLDLLELQLVCRALDVSLVSFVKRFDDVSKAS
jgi:transcriptional regulator with XRE-family HTH domain